jgi:hypothetical protein
MFNEPFLPLIILRFELICYFIVHIPAAHTIICVLHDVDSMQSIFLAAIYYIHFVRSIQLTFNSVGSLEIDIHPKSVVVSHNQYMISYTYLSKPPASNFCWSLKLKFVGIKNNNPHLETSELQYAPTSWQDTTPHQSIQPWYCITSHVEHYLFIFCNTPHILKASNIQYLYSTVSSSTHSLCLDRKGASSCRTVQYTVLMERVSILFPKSTKLHEVQYISMVTSYL